MKGKILIKITKTQSLSKKKHERFLEDDFFIIGHPLTVNEFCLQLNVDMKND